LEQLDKTLRALKNYSNLLKEIKIQLKKQKMKDIKGQDERTANCTV
jgi:hypothetical protein